MPVGTPIPWPTSTAPTGWIKCNGATFTAVSYPKLALAYPSLTLPDLRGEFIRGWDDGRGIDSDRALLSSQLGTITTLDIAENNTVWATLEKEGGVTSNFDMDPLGDNVNGIKRRTFTPSGTTAIILDAAVGGRMRSRNIAFNYIVRCA